MIGTLTPIYAYENEKYSYGNWEYIIVDGNITITKYLGSETNITVPATIEGKKVTQIGNEAFMSNEIVESIILPEGIVVLGEDAFYYCTKLQHIEIPNSVKTIKRFAFRYCYALTEINLPSELTVIEDRVFLYCKNLKNINIPESVTTIKFSAFAFCEKIGSITIPQNVENIEYSFEKYKSLSSINVESNNNFFSSKEGVLYDKEQSTLLLYPPAKESENFSVPSSVKHIRESAFAFCNNVERITIPQNVISIGEFAFYECTKLKEVKLSNAITSIEKGTFYNCTSVSSISIPQNVKKIGDRAFARCSNMKEVNLPKNLMEIGYASFEECKSLINVAIPESVNKIGSSAFAFCDGLNSIIIPSNVTSIESCTFYECVNLKEVNLSKNMLEIEYKSFNGCTKLEKIIIPSSVKTIGSAAFMSCEKLKTVKFMGKMPHEMGKNIFDKCSREFTILYPKRYKSSWSDYVDYPKASYNDVKNSVSKISLNKKRIILTKGKKYRLKRRITPLDADIKSVTWKSSNKKIATVSKKGLVRAKKVGTCTITVISKDGHKKAKCKIRVVAPIEEVKISEKQISVNKGRKYTLKATVKPNNATMKKVIWSSSNEKVARVSKGVVIGVKKGTCYITVKSRYGIKRAKCKVVVK